MVVTNDEFQLQYSLHIYQLSFSIILEVKSPPLSSTYLFVYLFVIELLFPNFFPKAHGSLLFLIILCSDYPRSGQWKPLQAGL